MSANPKTVIPHTKLKVTQIGNSLGVILPKEMISELGIGKGDELFVTKSPEGHVVSANDPAFEEQMTAVRQIMREYRNTLRELAK
jgi:putative addiction module antidote